MADVSPTGLSGGQEAEEDNTECVPTHQFHVGTSNCFFGRRNSVGRDSVGFQPLTSRRCPVSASMSPTSIAARSPAQSDEDQPRGIGRLNSQAKSPSASVGISTAPQAKPRSAHLTKCFPYRWPGFDKVVERAARAARGR